MTEIILNDSYISKKLSYERFAHLQYQIETCKDNDIQLKIDVQKRFGLTFVFLFSTLPFLAEKHNKNINLSLNKKTFNLLKKIGFFYDKDFNPSFNYGCLIKKESNVINKDKDVFKTVTEITKEAPIKMSPELSALFISKAGEMFNNAKEHSGGTVLGAKYFKYQKNTYCFSCYDTGIGIPRRVITSKPEITSEIEAFKWAMENGNSTASTGIPRGLGLGLLKNFAKTNDGRIRICSGKVLYQYNSAEGENITELDCSFQGTLFEMDIIADNNHKYILR